LVGVCPKAGVDPKALGVWPKGEGELEPKGELPNADGAWPNAGVLAGFPKTEVLVLPKAGVDWPKPLLPKALEVVCPKAAADWGCPKVEVLCREESGSGLSSSDWGFPS